MRCSSPSALHRVRRRSGRLIPFYGLDLLSGQKLSKFVVTVPRKKAAKVLSGFAHGPITPQQTLDCVRHFLRRAAIPDRTRNRLQRADRATQAKVIGIDQRAINLQLLAFEPDVSDPMLSATVRAASDVQFQLLVEAGQP